MWIKLEDTNMLKHYSCSVFHLFQIFCVHGLRILLLSFSLIVKFTSVLQQAEAQYTDVTYSKLALTGQNT